jgi:NarL family two-component system response regulator LiaR
MTASPTDIFIGYDDKLVYEGLASMLSAKPTYNVIGGAKNSEDVFKRLKFENPKVIIIELGVPTTANIEYLNNLNTQHPHPKIMLISSVCNNGNISKIMDSGIQSFILKSCNREDFFNALSHIDENKKYYCSTITQMLLKEYHDMKNKSNGVLTQRELDVLKGLVNGNTNKEISFKLQINESTVKTHRKNLMNKVGAGNLFSLVRYACRNKLMDFGMDSFCLGCPYRQ